MEKKEKAKIKKIAKNLKREGPKNPIPRRKANPVKPASKPEDKTYKTKKEIKLGEEIKKRGKGKGKRPKNATAGKRKRSKPGKREARGNEESKGSSSPISSSAKRERKPFFPHEF